ncbi:inositol polyphosphate phosphatase [Pseudozyma hubeiensis SY62]|uniref:Inositol polyphosphate phosphatase n=1 Tax=Pseudozyma hubeiensis (strain SY62) TaxID=1305764 RepID=R9P6Q7_PSEHS|nr:inositol polyphosphate phosphatase [Pseudozyma hubeiensis SY62]GAC97024.1 inositol polyphosphate phosphatase [Pseudozyma hubeiensis SY62]
MASAGPSSPSLASSVNEQPALHQPHQPPLRARLHALLQHSHSHSGSSPALSPTSDTHSQHHTDADPLSSSTSIESEAHAVTSPKMVALPPHPQPPKGALSVLPKTTTPSSSIHKPSVASSPPPKLAALPRSVTASNLGSSPAVAPRPESTSAGPSRASSLDPSQLPSAYTLPTSHTTSNVHPEHSSNQPRQRPSIKVRIITWNMHDSVPKGELEVLLGKAGPYVPPESDWDISYDSADDDDQHASQSARNQSRGQHVVGQEHVPRADRIPPLPHDDSHPYHLLVIAGQECPWGDGKRLATSVGMANELGDFGKQKARAAKDKDKDKDRSKPSKQKEKQRSGDSDSLPAIADANNKSAHSTTDEAPSSIQNRDGLQIPSDDNSFPFFSGPLSTALPGQPLASPMIGGSSMPGFGGSTTDLHNDDKLVAWPNIGGKGWSDLCEDWLVRNQHVKKDKEHKEKPFISGARLARALSHSASKKEVAQSSQSFALHDPQQSVPSHSVSAAVTPELSRAASPVGIPTSFSLPGTPNQSTLEGFGAFTDTPAPPPAESSPGADKRKRLVPKLNLNRLDIVKKSPASGRSSPANMTDAEYVSSPVLLSPTAIVPKTAQQLSSLSTVPSEQAAHAAEPSSVNASTSATPWLTVPGTPAMSRMSSSHSLSTLAAGSAVPSNNEVHVDPPTPSRTPSPYPDAQPGAKVGGQVPSNSAALAVPAASDAGAKAPEKSFADSMPKSLGPYELVIKERMMGCYMAVYVWRGCKDRIRGASRSHVKSGLLAGRVGNKGGVGISLKLGATRLLFVNAHLAAHEDKVALRLANVAKIKAALKVDSFLPTDDPRSRLEDITEQFDHTFWFGDLNFRIDISRQHADWLMMNKKYDQALAFDQLGKVLKEGDAFKGFKEAPIHFPPTYKYDVLSTLKLKRSKTQTSTRSAIDIPGASSTVTATAETSTTPLGESVIPEDSTVCFGEPDSQADQLGDASPAFFPKSGLNNDACSHLDSSRLASAPHGISPTAGDESIAAASDTHDPDRSDEDRYSIASSSAFGSMASSSGFVRAYRNQEARLPQDVDPALVRERELELQRQRQLAENTSAAQGPRFFSPGAAIKAKFKIMDMMRSATSTNIKEKLSSAVSADGQPGGRKKWLNVLTESPKKSAMTASASSDNNSIVDSINSMPSPGTELSTYAPDGDESCDAAGRRGSLLSSDGYPSSAGHGEMPTIRHVLSREGEALSSDKESESGAPAPVRAGPRRSSLQMAKATALAAAKAHREAKYPHLTGATAEQIDFLEAQPYDTSAKQRVPSWCDRVLFRSTVPLDPEDRDPEGDADDLKRSEHEAKLGSRVGSALSSALITPLRQAAERRHHMHPQRTASNGLIAAVAGSSSIAFADEKPFRAEVGPKGEVARKASATRRSQHSDRATTTSQPSVLSPKAVTRISAVDERTREPHLLQRFLHPARHRHRLKALSPSLTFSDSTDNTHDTAQWVVKNNSSIDLMPTSTSLGLESGAGLGLAGLETTRTAISTVDLPSQLEERDNRFDGAAKRSSSPLSALTSHAKIVIPPRQSSTSQNNSPMVNGRGWSFPSPTKEIASPATVSPLEVPQPPVRSASASAASEKPLSPPVSTRSVPSPGPRRTLSSSSTDRGGWMDSLSSHLPAFFAPAFSALRSHRHASQSIDATELPQHKEDAQPQTPLLGPKRGRIECLLYKSLDDREMRILEGRSDHRPVIFVGAIGI